MNRLVGEAESFEDVGDLFLEENTAKDAMRLCIQAQRVGAGHRGDRHQPEHERQARPHRDPVQPGAMRKSENSPV